MTPAHIAKTVYHAMGVHELEAKDPDGRVFNLLSEGEPLAFKGIPYFAPELFRSVRIRNGTMTSTMRMMRVAGRRRSVVIFGA